MAFNEKKPSIKVAIEKKKFNSLMEILNIVDEMNMEETKEMVKACRDKIMTYSYIIDEDFAELRFFPREAQYMLQILVAYITDLKPEKDYYDELFTNRMKYIESKKKEVE